MKEDYDGAEPTASSVSVMNLLVLSHLIDEPLWTDRIERTLLRSFGERLEQLGRGVPMMAAALSTYLAGVQQVIISRSGKPAAPADPATVEGAIANRYLPFAIVLTVTEEQRRKLKAILPLVAAMEPVDGKTAAYVCRNFSCRQPATTPEQLGEAFAS